MHTNDIINEAIDLKRVVSNGSCDFEVVKAMGLWVHEQS